MVDHLIDHGDLSADDRAAVDFLVARHVQKHGDNVETSLAAIRAGQPTRPWTAARSDRKRSGRTLTSKPSGRDPNSGRSRTL
jgi:hypothetical protein